MYRYLSHFALPPPPPWLWGSASRRQLSCQVCVNLSDSGWGKMERSLLAAVFTLLSVFSRPVCSEMLSRALPIKGRGRNEGATAAVLLPSNDRNLGDSPCLQQLVLECLSSAAHLILAACSSSHCHLPSLAGEEWGRGAEEWEERQVGHGSSSSDKLGAAFCPVWNQHAFSNCIFLFFRFSSTGGYVNIFCTFLFRVIIIYLITVLKLQIPFCFIFSLFFFFFSLLLIILFFTFFFLNYLAGIYNQDIFWAMGRPLS